MGRRGPKAFLMTVIVALMVGLRESTGLAPPPPILVTERVEWLSPESEKETPPVFLGEPGAVLHRTEQRTSSPRKGDLLRRTAAFVLRGLWRR